MHALLDRFGIKRGDVEILGTPRADGRDVLLSEAMRPSNATAQWHDRLAQPEISAHIARGMKNLAVIEAPNPEMEALAIAIAMREARHLGKSAALVTPDRALARRVMAALARWNLDYRRFRRRRADRNSGRHLCAACGRGGREGAGAADLAGAAEASAVPARRRGRRACARDRSARTRAAARHPPAAGQPRVWLEDFARFRSELKKHRDKEVSSLHGSEQRTRLQDWQLDRAEKLISALQAALAPMESLSPTKPYDFAEIATRHREVLIALSQDDDGIAVAFEEQEGLALAAAFDDLVAEQKPSGLSVTLPDYPEVFQTAFADRAVRRPEKPGATLHIYGPLESRLMQADRIIAGGLIEGVWPPAPRTDPWLSRPMRHELGLDLPERRIGLSAHDFAQLLGNEDVILSHSAKAGGAPAVASRFLHRLEAVAGEERWDAAKAAGEQYVDFALALDAPAEVKPIAQPAPTPPRATRPLRTVGHRRSRTGCAIPTRSTPSISSSCEPLDPVDMPLSAADRGSAIHDALGDFTKTCAKDLPADPVARAARDRRETFSRR